MIVIVVIGCLCVALVAWVVAALVNDRGDK